MPARTISGLGFTLLAMAVVAAALALVMNTPARFAGRVAHRRERRAAGATPRPNSEAIALREARAAGAFGKREQVVLAAALGMGGRATDERRHRRLGAGDAVDPNAPFVYMVSTRYAPKSCPGNCPSPWMALGISLGRRSHLVSGFRCMQGNRPSSIPSSKSSRTPATSTLYMNGFNTVFIKSTNHGQTSPRPSRRTDRSRTDVVPAMSNDGQHVYVSERLNAGDPYVAQSHNAGATTQTKPSTGRGTSSPTTRMSSRTELSCSRRAASTTAARGRRRPARSNIMRSCRRTRAPRGATCSSIPWSIG